MRLLLNATFWSRVLQHLRAVDAIKFTVDQKAVGQTTKTEGEAAQSTSYARVGDGGEGECISCGA
jgi:hypothetical protein